MIKERFDLLKNKIMCIAHDIDVDLAVLKKLNPDIVGWIYFEGDVGISYPLLYSGDDYYLKHNYQKEEESAGSIYIDKNNNPDLSDAHIVTLSTCSYDSDVRFTVSAVRIDEHE